MVGYLSHVVVDLTHASQLAGAQPADAPDLMRLIDNIAIHFDDMIAATKQAYGVDMRSVWHFWAFGDLLNAVGGPDATTQARRVAFLSDAGIVAESIALQNPALHDVTEAGLYAQWVVSDAVLTGAAQLNLL
jgi:hypothetical protein